VRQFILTNNPKVVGREGYGLEMSEQEVPIRVEANPHNPKYLRNQENKAPATCCQNLSAERRHGDTAPWHN